jgi:hypothetical protein
LTDEEHWCKNNFTMIIDFLCLVFFLSDEIPRSSESVCAKKLCCCVFSVKLNYAVFVEGAHGPIGSLSTSPYTNVNGCSSDRWNTPNSRHHEDIYPLSLKSPPCSRCQFSIRAYPTFSSGQSYFNQGKGLVVWSFVVCCMVGIVYNCSVLKSVQSVL